MDWRALAVGERERQFNPRVAVGNDRAEAYLAEYAARSAAARGRMRALFDVRYGTGAKATFDLFLPESPRPAPVFAFVHGGYWRALDKQEHHFVVEPAVRAGFAGLVVNYDLCPAVTLDDIVAELRDFARFLMAEGAGLGMDVERIALAGHSAGAHLIACLLHDVAAVMPVAWANLASGIFEPAAILELTINADVRLSPEMAARNDALARPPRTGAEIEVSVGGEEPPHWIAQSGAYAALSRDTGRPTTLRVAPGADHFSLLFEPILPPVQPSRVVAP